MFTDSHCHISKNDYENIDLIIENAKKNGIIKMINNASDIETAKEVLELNEKYSNMYAAVGFHPEVASDMDISNLDIIEKNIDKLVAIGEIGLDYHYEPCDRERQKELFISQLKIAEKYGKKVIVHSREATKDTIDILKMFPTVKGSIHCFSGSYEIALEYLKMGYKLGIGGVLTFKNSKLYEVIEKLPVDSFILETDSPYLSPEPKRGQKNEPANVYYIAQRMAELKNISLEELSKITEKNISELFDI